MTTINRDNQTLSDLHMLLDLVHVDGTIEDLDIHHESEFGTLGAVLLKLMRQHQAMRDALMKIQKLPTNRAALEACILADCAMSKFSKKGDDE